jgi:hypothetical protein
VANLVKQGKDRGSCGMIGRVDPVKLALEPAVLYFLWDRCDAVDADQTAVHTRSLFSCTSSLFLLYSFSNGFVPDNLQLFVWSQQSDLFVDSCISCDDKLLLY